MTTTFLDNRQAIEKLDQDHGLQSIEELGSQITDIWELSQALEAPKKYANPTNIIVCGMGGSILGTDVIQSLYKDSLPAPITIVPDYTLPAFADENSLVIAASYSGNTAETWSAVQAAHKKGAMIAGVTSGGKIGDFLKENSYPHLVFKTNHNPSQIAKMGLGYSIFGQMMLFAKLGLITITKPDYQTILDAIAAAHLKMSQQVDQEKNLAKVLAFELVDTFPRLLSAEHLSGASHVFSNQLNENAKTMAGYDVIPEFNHHFLEALQFPKLGKEYATFVSIHSNLYQTENQARVDVTETALQDHDLNVVTYQTTETTKLGQIWEVITLGAYTAFYLAMLSDVNPIPNKTVDWFKKELDTQ